MRHILLLLISCCAVAADGAVKATASYEHLRRVTIAISAPSAPGATAIVLAGTRELAQATLGEDGRGLAVLPMPPPGQPYGELSLVVGGRPAVALPLANADQQRAEALAEAKLVFHPSVFTGTSFPSCDFRDPLLVEELLGAYTLRATFYDQERKEVRRAEHPGFYGAVVTATGERGTPLTRCVSLYRLPGEVHWWRERYHASLTLPPQTGLDPVVQREQSGLMDEFVGLRLDTALNDGAPLPALLARLSSTPPGSAPLPQRLSLHGSEEGWWFPLRKSLGLVKHRYLTFLPDGYQADPQQRFPLLLFLHGSGERGLDVELVRKHGPHRFWAGRKSPFIIIAPQCDPGAWWSPVAVADLLDEVQAALRVDAARIYLTGLSMGGYGAWATACAYPERFAALVPICGGGDPQDVARLKGLPTWVFHGAKDPTVPLACSTEMVEALKLAGNEARCTIYAEAGHDAWTRAYATQELYDWMLAQHR